MDKIIEKMKVDYERKISNPRQVLPEVLIFVQIIWHLVPEGDSTICKPLETQSMNVNKKIRELENVAFIKL